MTATERLLLGSLCGASAISAVDLGHRCGVPHESLYQALVRLEAAGLVRVVVNHIRGNQHERLWREA